jgi:hypothetical protein
MRQIHYVCHESALDPALVKANVEITKRYRMSVNRGNQTTDEEDGEDEPAGSFLCSIQYGKKFNRRGRSGTPVRTSALISDLCGLFFREVSAFI